MIISMSLKLTNFWQHRNATNSITITQ